MNLYQKSQEHIQEKTPLYFSETTNKIAYNKKKKNNLTEYASNKELDIVYTSQPTWTNGNTTPITEHCLTTQNQFSYNSVGKKFWK